MAAHDWTDCEGFHRRDFLKTTAAVGGYRSSLSQRPILSRVGASGSSTSRSPLDSTKVEVTTGCQSAPASQNGCLARQIQSPGAKSRIPTCN